MEKSLVLFFGLAFVIAASPSALGQGNAEDPDRELRLRRIADMAEMNARIGNLQESEFVKFLEISAEQAESIERLRLRLN